MAKTLVTQWRERHGFIPTADVQECLVALINDVEALRQAQNELVALNKEIMEFQRSLAALIESRDQLLRNKLEEMRARKDQS